MEAAIRYPVGAPASASCNLGTRLCMRQSIQARLPNPSRKIDRYNVTSSGTSTVMTVRSSFLLARKRTELKCHPLDCDLESKPLFSSSATITRHRRIERSVLVRSKAVTFPEEEFRPNTITTSNEDGAGSIWKSISRSIGDLSPNGVTGELVVLALPAVLAGMAEPIAQLTETAFVSRAGAVSLAAIGVSVSIFNLISKVFNFPLLNITTSFVSEDGEARAKAEGKDAGMSTVVSSSSSSSSKPVIPAVSAALLVASILGVIEACVLTAAAAPILGFMGVPESSPMRSPALHYLSLRALSAPAVVLSLAVQGVFRGLKDTHTPLTAQVCGNLIHVALLPLLMFACGLGLQGAALATVCAQYCIAAFLLCQLQQRVALMPPSLAELRLNRFLKSGGFLLCRTLALLLTMTLATSMAARQGPLPMAAHQIAMQVWLAASLLSDSVALGAQTMLASAFARHDSERVKIIAKRSLQIGLAMGVTMGALLALSSPHIPQAFTSDPEVAQGVIMLMPFVAATQPITSLAFVFDGLHYGASDFAYAATAMMLAMPPIAGFLAFAPRVWGINGVWIGLCAVMTARLLIGVARVLSASGPWTILKEDGSRHSQQLHSKTS